MADWSAELTGLKKAYAAGTLRVSYDGKSVEYGSADDLLRRIHTLEGWTATETGARRHVCSYAAFGKG